MAYWNIRFKSRDGNTYLIQIGGKTGSTDVELLGAAEPFTTEEQNTDDIFTPVLTESGYISIYDNGYDQAGNAFDWHDLIPQNAKARPVTVDKVLPNQRAEVWRGYLQPQTFQGEYLEEGQERKFPVVNSLSALGSEDIDPEAYSGAVNFARLIYYLTGFVVEYKFNGANALDWLQLNVNWSIFSDVEDDDQTAYGVIYKPKYNKLQVLEEVCRFFGWTCRQKDRTLYFSSPDSDISDTWISMDDEEFDGLGDGTVPQPGYPSWNTLTLSGSNKFASADNDEIVLPGVRKVTVKAEVDNEDNFLTVNEGDIEEGMRGMGFTHAQDGDYFFYKRYPYEPERVNDIILNYANTQTQGSYYQQFDPGKVADLPYKHNFNWETSLFVYGRNTVLFSMTSNRTFSFNHGCIVISGTIFIELDAFGQYHPTERLIGKGTLECTLRIGNLYWNGTQWTAQLSHFSVPTGSPTNEPVNTSGTGQILCNRPLESDYGEYDGYGIPVPSGGIGGIAYFNIYSVVMDTEYIILAGDDQHVNIKGLKVSFVKDRTYSLTNENNENKYTAENNVKFSEEREESTIFASDNNNTNGQNIIMDDDMIYVSEIGYDVDGGGYTAHPEQHLADRMANFHLRPRTMLELELDTADVGNVAPDYKVQDYNDRTYYPLVISREWREGITKLKLIEL
jgi:hypothetical protein